MTTEDELVGWHQQLDGHEFEKTPGIGDGHGSLACCSPQGQKESDTTERLNCPLLSLIVAQLYCTASIVPQKRGTVLHSLLLPEPLVIHST